MPELPLLYSRIVPNFLSIKWSIAPMLLALVLAAGCGGSGSNEVEVSVTTGSLSKAQFISKANTLCAAARSQFNREYVAFTKAHKTPASTAAQEAWIGEVVDTILLPSYERRIKEIGALGAPSSDEQEVSEFLDTFAQRLEEIQEEPTKLSASPYPFARAAKLAKAYGLDGCASSFG